MATHNSQIALTANLYGHAYTSVLRESVDWVGAILAPENPVATTLATTRKQRSESR